MELWRFLVREKRGVYIHTFYKKIEKEKGKLHIQVQEGVCSKGF